MRTRVQRASTSSSVWPTLRLSLSTSSSVFSSGKCDTTATNAERDPQQTLLAALASIRPLSNPAAADIDAEREDGPSVLSSSKSRTHVAEVCKASSFTSASHQAANSTLSYVMAWSRRSANPHGRPLKPRALLHHLLEFGSQLTHNLHVDDVVG
jgi:hypothetical protein